METQTSSWGDDFDGRPEKLPTFLKVLCILTFIGSGFGFLGGIYGAVSGESTRASFRLLRSVDNPMIPSSITDEQINNLVHWQTIGGIVGMIAALLTLTGALLMWKRKKAGFLVYLGGEIAPIPVGLMSAAAASGLGFMGMSTMVGAVGGIIVAAAFIIMYAFNYKHLR